MAKKVTTAPKGGSATAAPKKLEAMSEEILMAEEDRYEAMRQTRRAEDNLDHAQRERLLFEHQVALTYLQHTSLAGVDAKAAAAWCAEFVIHYRNGLVPLPLPNCWGGMVMPTTDVPPATHDNPPDVAADEMPL